MPALPTFVDPRDGGAYITFVDGSGALRVITFDCTVRVLHNGTAVVTEHPVDQGANVADNIRPENRRLTLEVEVTNTPVLVPAGKQGGVAPLVLSLGDVSEMISPAAASSSQTSLFGFGTVGSVSVTPAAYQASPRTVTVNVLQFATVFDRVREVSEALEELRVGGTLVSVTTKLRQYPTMAIASVSEPEEAADSITFTIELVAVRLAQSETVEVQPPTKELRAKKKTTAGTQTGYTPPDNTKSGITAALDALPEGLKKHLKGF